MKKLADVKIALVSLQKDTSREPPFGLVYVGTYLRDSIGIKNIKIIDNNYSEVEEELKELNSLRS